MVGEITFSSETEFEKKIGEKNSEYMITEGTYKIEGNTIILTITFDSNSSYTNGQGSNVFEQYTEENKINELDLYELESIILQIVKNELKHIEILGFILG